MPQIDDLKIFAGAKMERDRHLSYLGKNEFYEIRNIRCNTSEDDDVGIGEGILGNELVSNPDLPDGDFKVIGSAKDGENHDIYYFVYDGSVNQNHGIYRYDIDTQSIDFVFIGSELNFQRRYLINHAGVIGDLLYWTDNYESITDPFGDRNPPRKINFSKLYNTTHKDWYGSLTEWQEGAVYNVGDYVHYEEVVYQVINYHVSSGVTTPPDYPSFYAAYELHNTDEFYLEITDEMFDRAKAPPTYPISALNGDYEIGGETYTVTGGFYEDESLKGNTLRGNSFQFVYRWKYDDNEETTWSPISKSFFSMEGVMADGTYDDQLTKGNSIAFGVNVGPRSVKRVDIAVREGNSGNFRLIDRIYKFSDDGYTLGYAENEIITYTFQNDLIGEGLDQEGIFKPFDYVPQISGSMDIAEKNKIIDGNYIEGYDNVDIDVELNYSLNQVSMEGSYDDLPSQNPSSPSNDTPGWVEIKNSLNGFTYVVTVLGYKSDGIWTTYVVSHTYSGTGGPNSIATALVGKLRDVTGADESTIYTGTTEPWKIFFKNRALQCMAHYKV